MSKVTLIRIDPDLAKRLKVLAALNGFTVKATAEGYLRKAIELDEPAWGIRVQSRSVGHGE